MRDWLRRDSLGGYGHGGRDVVVGPVVARSWRWARSRHPFIYEINTWPWLTELADYVGAPVDLATVPDERWDEIADLGFDAVWLMGVWQRSPAGIAVALADRDLTAGFAAALADWTPDDVVGSPYCIKEYEVDGRLGGRAGLAKARSALAVRGVALFLDFVPNHVAPDHRWTSSHPEFFVSGTFDDLGSDRGSFIEVGGAVLARGRDPYFPPWPDVVQLNAFEPAVREVAIETLRDIAGQCDGVRCDMAMLVMNDVFARTWGARVGDSPTDHYWPTVIEAVRRSHPDFVFIAEAYWDMEWALQRQGFDFCYDKGFYDRLRDGTAHELRAHLSADVDFQNRLVRFAENHDEPRAAAGHGLARQKAVTVAVLTQTGARLVHHGQLEGRRVQLPVFLGRAPREVDDVALRDFQHALLATLRDDAFRTGTWSLCESLGRPDDESSANLVGWSWNGDRRWLIIVNFGAESASGLIRVSWADSGGLTHRLTDPLTGFDVVRTGDQLRGGLNVELGPWQWHLFMVESTDGG